MFKRDFLSGISEDDLKQEIVLSVGFPKKGAGEDSEGLRQQLMDILEEQ